MGDILDGILVLIVLLDLATLGASRMRTVIHATALQGVLLSILPLFQQNQPSVHLVLICVGTMTGKGLVIPLLLMRAMRDVTVRREIEPLIGFTLSLLVGAFVTGMALLFSDNLPLIDQHASDRIVPASLSTVFTGFLVLTTRQKAVIQVAGYLILENGIFLFGLLLLEALPLLVELGVLLDLLVGIFVMAIILQRIQRTFSTNDSSGLASLRE